ncbi:MAG: phospholipase [Muribaculaceae bacterium]|nr:phospholipase [Muribaculaceae bacterium]
MLAALIILAALFGVGLVLYVHDRRTRGEERNPVTEPESECCGMHITCEKDSLLASVSPTVEYYDDEELDRYAGMGADDYSPGQVEEFRDVLLTMRPDDIAGWARSLQLRQIELPREVRDELIMIVAETRRMRDVTVS